MSVPADRRMNILMAAGVSRRREGGAAAIAYNFGRELERRGHRVSYMFLEDLMDQNPGPARFHELIFSQRLARYIVKNRSQFSLVHVHAPAGLVYGLRRRLFRPRGLPPCVMLLHGLEERRVEVMSREAKKGRASHFSRRNRLWHRYYIYPRFRWSIRTADGAHVYSRDVWNVLQLNYHLDSDRVAYIANGAEQRFFVPREYPGTCAPRLLYAGTWLDQRGVFYIRDALRNLVRCNPGLKMTFAGCGIPEQEIAAFFGADLAEHIVVRSVIPADVMQELYLEHDIFLFPSLVEGLPSVLLEAMATGMPVITTETCGMPDIVEDEVNGLLIPPANAAAIESAVKRLADSQQLRKNLGVAARETMQRHTWECAGQKLEKFFYHVLELDRR